MLGSLDPLFGGFSDRPNDDDDASARAKHPHIPWRTKELRRRHRRSKRENEKERRRPIPTRWSQMFLSVLFNECSGRECRTFLPVCIQSPQLINYD